MLSNAKALIVILVLAALTFHICRPICLRFMSQGAFVRRRNVWLTLTAVAFLSPSFWIYAIVALVLLAWASRRDENPLALFVLVTFAIPNVDFYIPAPVVNQLFDLTQYRILSFAIVVPMIFLRRSSSSPAAPGLRWEDVLLAAFLLLQVALEIPYESVTNTLRRGFLFGVDVFIVFYAFSRLTSREGIADVMCSFWLSCVVMASIAIFESLKGWLLYTGLGVEWGDPNVFAWLFRGDALRVQAAAGNSINLGYHLAMATGMYLFLRAPFEKRWTDLAVIATLSLGVLATFSRGAWVAAILVFVFYVALRPGAVRRLTTLLAFGAVAIAIMYITPLKHIVLDQLPFIGTVNQDTVDYRRKLAELSWELIQQNPWFGDPFVFRRMEALRQGQGIIDIVNGYLFTALFDGLVGLALLVAFFGTSLLRGLHAHFSGGRDDPQLGPMGASLAACVVATLIFIATAGFGTTMYVLCGLLVSYATVASIQRQSVSRPARRTFAFPARPLDLQRP